MTPPDEPWEPLDTDAPDAPPVANKLREVRDGDSADEWLSGLSCGDKGPYATLGNAIWALARCPLWNGVLAFNEFDGSVVKLKEPPMEQAERPKDFRLGEWNDTDTSLCCAWLARVAGIRLHPTLVGRAVFAVAQKSKFHPVRQYLDGLVWDGKVRLTSWLSRYMGAEQNAYTAAVGSRWLLSAVARVYEPGCKVDHVLVLEGSQGTGKSSALEVLAGMDWFSDTPLVFGDKDSYEALRGVLIYELAELSALRKSDVEAQKAYISKRFDRYRRPYGETNTTWPRQVIFAGTTNDAKYLADPTGNRRFWPVTCSDIDLDALKRDRDQLWAEALVRHREKEQWHLDSPELVALASAAQQDRVIEDDWEILIARWVESDAGKYMIGRGDGLAIPDVLSSAIGVKPDKNDRAASTRCGIQLKKLGWVVKRKVPIAGCREWRLFRSVTEYDARFGSRAGAEVGAEVGQTPEVGQDSDGNGTL